MNDEKYESVHYQCPVCAVRVILWFMDVAMLYRVAFASVGSIICLVQKKQYFFLQWLSYFKQMKRFLSNINMSKWITQMWQHFSWQ